MNKRIIAALLAVLMLLTVASCKQSAVPDAETAIEIAKDYIKDSMYEELSPYLEAEYLPKQKQWMVSTPRIFIEGEAVRYRIEVLIRRDGSIEKFTQIGG